MKWIVYFICSSLMATPITHHSISQDAITGLQEQVGCTHHKWGRKLNQMRWQVDELDDPAKEIVLKWGGEQNMFCEWAPSEQVYDAALILGSTTVSMRARLSYLHELHERGVLFSKVVFLTGERPLDPVRDEFIDICKFESDTPEHIWNEMAIPNVEMENVIARKKFLRLPNTEDTLHAYLATKPTATRILIISQQPYAIYQYAVIDRVLPDTINFDVVAKALSNPKEMPRIGITTANTVQRYVSIQSGHP